MAQYATANAGRRKASLFARGYETPRTLSPVPSGKATALSRTLLQLHQAAGRPGPTDVHCKLIAITYRVGKHTHPPIVAGALHDSGSSFDLQTGP